MAAAFFFLFSTTVSLFGFFYVGLTLRHHWKNRRKIEDIFPEAAAASVPSTETNAGFETRTERTLPSTPDSVN